MREKQNQKHLKRHIRESGWVYRKTPTGKHNNYSSKLFNRQRPRIQDFREKYQHKINSRRARKRIRGNDYFHKKKYR